MPSERPDHASGSKAWSHIIVALVSDVDRWPRDRIFAIASSVRGPREASAPRNGSRREPREMGFASRTSSRS